jgi:LacI family transcriptional regulator
MEAAVRHLHQLGHRRIVLLSPEKSRGPWSRLRGLERARAGLGLDPAECYCFDGGTEDNLPQAAVELLRRRPRPTAVICTSDWTAADLLQIAVERLGLRVPDELSVVGFAASVWGERAPVPLTTVTYHTARLGREIVTLLQRAVAPHGSPRAPATVVIDPGLIVRASTGPAP